MMFFTVLSVAALVTGVFAQNLMINTPSSPLECVPTQLTFTGGTAPFTITVQTPDANGAIIQTFTGIQSSPFVWATNVTAPISLGLSIRDSTGALGQSGQFNVATSPDSSCLNASGSSSASTQTNSGSSGTNGPTVTTPNTSGSSAPSTSASTTSSSSSSSTTSSSSSSSSPSSSRSSSSSTSSTSSSTSPSPTGNGAGDFNSAAGGVAGIVGFVLAGLMA